MKKLFNLLVITMFFSLISCDGENFEENQNEKQYSPIGVWECGNYFLSLSSDNFLTAYFAERFLDCGNYSLSGDTLIICNNTYYARPTKYKIENITDNGLQVTISYTDMEGVERVKTMTFTKSDKIPTTKDNPVVGKSYGTRLSSANITTTFTTYNTGMRTADSGSMKKYPLSMYYIYYDGCIYFQTFKTTTQMPSIGGWNPSKDIIVWQLEFDSDGSIASHNVITSTAL